MLSKKPCLATPVGHHRCGPSGQRPANHCNYGNDDCAAAGTWVGNAGLEGSLQGNRRPAAHGNAVNHEDAQTCVG